MQAPWRGDLSALRGATGHRLRTVAVYGLEGRVSNPDGELIGADQGLDLIFENCVVGVAWLSPGDVEGIGSTHGPFSSRLIDAPPAVAIPELAPAGAKLLQVLVEEQYSDKDHAPTALALSFDTGDVLHIILGELTADGPAPSATSLICQLRAN